MLNRIDPFWLFLLGGGAVGSVFGTAVAYFMLAPIAQGAILGGLIGALVGLFILFP